MAIVREDDTSQNIPTWAIWIPQKKYSLCMPSLILCGWWYNYHFGHSILAKTISQVIIYVHQFDGVPETQKLSQPKKEHIFRQKNAELGGQWNYCWTSQSWLARKTHIIEIKILVGAIFICRFQANTDLIETMSQNSSNLSAQAYIEVLWSQYSNHSKVQVAYIIFKF